LANCIRAAIFYDGGSPYGFNISGHAGSAPKGHNLACAAVSVLVRTVSRYLINLNLVTQYELLANEVKLMARKENDKVITALQILEQGLNDIALEYPKLIKLDKVGE